MPAPSNEVYASEGGSVEALTLVFSIEAWGQMLTRAFSEQ